MRSFAPDVLENSGLKFTPLEFETRMLRSGGGYYRVKIYSVGV